MSHACVGGGPYRARGRSLCPGARPGGKAQRKLGGAVRESVRGAGGPAGRVRGPGGEQFGAALRRRSDDVLSNVATWLRPSGMLVASMEHPAVTAGHGIGEVDGPIIPDYADE